MHDIKKLRSLGGFLLTMAIGVAISIALIEYTNIELAAENDVAKFGLMLGLGLLSVMSIVASHFPNLPTFKSRTAAIVVVTLLFTHTIFFASMSRSGTATVVDIKASADKNFVTQQNTIAHTAANTAREFQSIQYLTKSNQTLEMANESAKNAHAVDSTRKPTLDERFGGMAAILNQVLAWASLPFQLTGATLFNISIIAMVFMLSIAEMAFSFFSAECFSKAKKLECERARLIEQERQRAQRKRERDDKRARRRARKTGTGTAVTPPAKTPENTSVDTVDSERTGTVATPTVTSSTPPNPPQSALDALDEKRAQDVTGRAQQAQARRHKTSTRTRKRAHSGGESRAANVIKFPKNDNRYTDIKTRIVNGELEPTVRALKNTGMGTPVAKRYLLQLSDEGILEYETHGNRTTFTLADTRAAARHHKK